VGETVIRAFNTTDTWASMEDSPLIGTKHEFAYLTHLSGGLGRAKFWNCKIYIYVAKSSQGKSGQMKVSNKFCNTTGRKETFAPGRLPIRPDRPDLKGSGLAKPD
jgi:hypothetical protein